MKHLLLFGTITTTLIFAGCANETGDEICTEAVQRMMLCGSDTIMNSCNPAAAEQIVNMSCDEIETMGGKGEGEFTYVGKDDALRFELVPNTITKLESATRELEKDLQGLYVYAGLRDEFTTPVVIFDGSILQPDQLYSKNLSLPELLSYLNVDQRGRSRIVSMLRLSHNQEWGSFIYAGQAYSIQLDSSRNNSRVVGEFKKFTPENHKTFGRPLVKGVLNHRNVLAFWYGENFYNVEVTNVMVDVRPADGRFAATVRRCSNNSNNKELCFVHDKQPLGSQTEVRSITRYQNPPKWRNYAWDEQIDDFHILFWDNGFDDSVHYELYGPAGAMDFPKLTVTAPQEPTQDVFDCSKDCPYGCNDLLGCAQPRQEPPPVGPTVSTLCPPPADQPGLTGCPLDTHDCVGVVWDLKRTKYNLQCVKRDPANPRDCSYLLASGVPIERLASHFRQCPPDGMNGCAGWQFCMHEDNLKGVTLDAPLWSPKCIKIDDKTTYPLGKTWGKTTQGWFEHYLGKPKETLFACNKSPVAQQEEIVPF